MIKVSGAAKVLVGYTAEIDMTEEEFDSMSIQDRNELLEKEIDHDGILEIEIYETEGVHHD